jgi:hypothetical protein
MDLMDLTRAGREIHEIHEIHGAKVRSNTVELALIVAETRSCDSSFPSGGTGEHFWVPLVVLDQCLHSFDQHVKARRGSPRSGRESSEGLRVDLPLVHLVRSDGRCTIANRPTFRRVADGPGSLGCRQSRPQRPSRTGGSDHNLRLLASIENGGVRAAPGPEIVGPPAKSTGRVRPVAPRNDHQCQTPEHGNEIQALFCLRVITNSTVLAVNPRA